MTDVQFAYDEDETALREAVRSMLVSVCTPEALSTAFAGDRSLLDRVRDALRDQLGLGGLLLDEDALAFAGVVAEELGRQVAPAPFLTSAAIAATVVSAVADQSLVDEVAAGRTLAVPVPWSSAYDDVRPVARIDADGTLTGIASHVVGVLEADGLLVPAIGADGVLELHLVAADALGVERRLVTALDMTRPLATVTLSGVASVRVGRGVVVDAALRRGLAVGTILLGSEQLGLADEVLRSTVDYLRTRRQFGRELGSFQALKHRVADLWVDLEGLRAVARYGVLAATDPLEYRASLVAAYASDVVVQLVEECLQLHGGIAMTWEHPLHYALKRAKSNQIALGPSGRHRMLLAELVGLAAADVSPREPALS
ncbi:acyl-CoA dehydrogenase family protein [Nocardioides ginsengisoli]|uniref:Acyl-CoA dehydrogenase family protein n=1 Tax=Nocardioides ginsengisoli TaxID=363868 RepID=A0ABW3W558_9ACTN